MLVAMGPARRLLAVAATAGLLAGCASGPGASPPTGVDGLQVPTPSPDPADFVERIDNPLLPLVPGNEWVYESSEGETTTVRVTDRTREVAGVATTVVRDVVTDETGETIERTFDWFAQDRAGNVWYFGEATTAYDARGRPDHTGSWEAGVDGAEAGLVMAAHPRVGDGYRQESDPGVAEDRAQVLSVDETVNLELGLFTHLLVTEETTPLEPDVLERKYYAPGVGLVLERTLSGGDERRTLVEFTGPSATR